MRLGATPAPLSAALLSAVLLSAALLSAALPFGCSDGAGPDELSAEEQANVRVVTSVIQQGWVAGDTGVINRSVREDYIQHSLAAQDGRAGMLASVALQQSRGPTAAQIHRVLADGDFVALHVSYGVDDPATLSDERTVAFDVFRLEDGLLAEHWDALAPAVTGRESVSGHSMVDGPTQVMNRGQTETNRQRVEEFVDLVFTRGQYDLLDSYLKDPYYQHDPLAGDGIAGIQVFVAQATARGLAIGYTSSPLVVADGNYVLVGSEGYLGPAAVRPFAVFYDLWRVEAGMLIEHWDLIPSVPADLSTIPHRNGVFCPSAPCSIR